MRIEGKFVEFPFDAHAGMSRGLFNQAFRHRYPAETERVANPDYPRFLHVDESSHLDAGLDNKAIIGQGHRHFHGARERGSEGVRICLLGIEFIPRPFADEISHAEAIAVPVRMFRNIENA